MATIRPYHDCRTLRLDGTAPIKVKIAHHSKEVYITTEINIRPDQWDTQAAKVIKHPHKQHLNSLIIHLLSDLDVFILKLIDSGVLHRLSAKDIKTRFLASRSPDAIPADNGIMEFEEAFEAFIDKKQGSTRGVYQHTLNRLRKFCPELSTVTWEQITPAWLSQFDAFQAQTSPSKNARAVHLRNIRAVFNFAIDAEATTCYPFRRFKIRQEPTKKRSLSVEELRRLFEFQVEEYAEIYRDMFKLIFMLVGINAVDLHQLKGITPDGRVEYLRAKTHRPYSIKVEPEAMEIINKYRGKSGLLCISDRWSDHRNFIHQANKALKHIGCTRSGLGGKKDDNGAFPGLSTYWARHTWATIAYMLDIPINVIGQALGHSEGKSVTEIYIRRDPAKVDAANRKVLDWVLYGRR